MSKFSKIAFLMSGISLVSMSLIRYIVGDWVPFCWISLGLAVFLVIAGVYKDRVFFNEFFAMKTTKEGTSMGLLILMMVALLGIINYLGGKYYKSWDFSVSQSNTLSQQSVQLVKSLDSDLKVLFFYKKGVEGNEENRRFARELIKKYQDQSPKITLNFVEVNERPDLSVEYGVDKGSGVVFLDYKGRRNRIEKIDEQEFTSALVKVTREKVKTIYFTIGHGEKNITENKEGLGLGSLRVMLENNRYTVKEMSLLQDSKVPQDADVIVVAGPEQSFQDFEVTALENYVKAGGSLFLALEPQKTAGLEKLVNKLGLVFENNFIYNVVDTSMGRGVNQGPAMGSVFSDSNKITQNFGRTEVTLFRFPQGLKRVNPPPGIIIDEIVKTSKNAVAYDTPKIAGDVEEAARTLVVEISGVEHTTEKALSKNFTMIVAGDVDFFTNQMLYQNLNRDLVLNSIAALAKEENLISITPKDPQMTQMFLTNTKFAIFLFGFIIPLPLLLLGLSVGIYFKRRNA